MRIFHFLPPPSRHTVWKGGVFLICRFGPTALDYLDEGTACRIYVYWSTLGGYPSLLGAVCRLRWRGRKPIRAYIDSTDPAECRLGRVLAWIGATACDSIFDHRFPEFYLP